MSYRKARYGLMSVLALLIPAVAPAADSVTRGNDSVNLPSRPATCEADLNGDRAVNILDLIELLTRFGLCPDEQSDWTEFTVDDAIDDGRTPALDNSGDAGDAVSDVPQDDISDIVERERVPQDAISDDRVEGDRRPAASDAGLRAAKACMGDLNDDGMVDTVDLIDLLSAPWGPCP